MNNLYKKYLSLIVFIALTISVTSQVTDTPGKTIKVAAGAEYKRSSWYQTLWGHNYRKEWTTPVTFPVLMLDTAYGGLKPYKQGGGHQSKSLHLKNPDGKEYAIRSVDKTLKVIIPPIFQRTFIEHIANDEISMSHPYASLSISGMAKAANIYHTYPRYVYVPQQPALDTLSKKYGNTLYLIEQRPDGDWSNADNLGNFDKFINSEKVREKIFEDNSHQVDQLAFVKARLFDMFIGDWDRHEDQWKWGTVEKDGKTFYIPIPVDRDQPYAKYDGVLLKLAISAAGMKYLQNFGNDIKYPEGFSYERRNIDRFFTNRVTLNQWQSIAKELQQSLTDNTIETSIKQMPPEIFAISGNDIISKLKSRRTHLAEYAARYYLFLSKTVDIVGSYKREYFEVKRFDDGAEINVYDLKNGEKRDTPFYSRKFNENETNEIRLYGLSGKDIYHVEGSSNKGIKIRIIGGDNIDSVIVSGSGKKVHIYDDHDKNIFILHSKAKLHLSSDSMVHAFDYDAFRPEKKGISPTFSYTDEDRFYVGIGYGWVHQAFRKIPYAFKQNIFVNYSISHAISAVYTGIFPKLLGNWNLLLKGGYDAVRWTNFFGLGNETVIVSNRSNYHRMQTRQWGGNASLNRIVGQSNFTFSSFYNSVHILINEERFLDKNYFPLHPEKFETNNFVGASFNYSVAHVNDFLVPERGVIFSALARYTQNLKDGSRSFADFGGNLQLYIPFIPKLSFAITNGIATVTGTPEFYQYANIGGGNNLRGFKREKFWGKTAFYNSNELRFITNIHTYIVNGKGGLVVFFDDGRVWMPSEKSNTWHTGYGGGFLFAPFNTLFFDVTYGISKESGLVQLRVRRKL